MVGIIIVADVTGRLRAMLGHQVWFFEDEELRTNPS